MGRKSAIKSWGPAAWTILHTISFAYPKKPTQRDRERVYEFMHAFSNVLPCARCRNDWVTYLADNLFSANSHHLQSRLAFSRFMVTAHNHVNEKLGKRTVDYATAARIYDPERPASISTNFCIATIVIGSVVTFGVFHLISQGCVSARVLSSRAKEYPAL